MNKTRIAVVGAGYIGQAHIAVAQHSASVTLSAIVDPAPAAIALAARCGVPHYKSIEDLLAGERPDEAGTPAFACEHSGGAKAA